MSWKCTICSRLVEENELCSCHADNEGIWTCNKCGQSGNGISYAERHKCLNKLQQEIEPIDKVVSQIDKLAFYIMSNVDGEPSQDEGAGDCAIRIITSLKQEIVELREQLKTKDKYIDILSTEITAGKIKILDLEKQLDVAVETLESTRKVLMEDAKYFDMANTSMAMNCRMQIKKIELFRDHIAQMRKEK